MTKYLLIYLSIWKKPDISHRRMEHLNVSLN